MAHSIPGRPKHLVRAGSWWIAASLASFLVMPAVQAQPQFNQGFAHAGQAAPANSGENSAYSAAISQPDPQVRASAIQQFLVQYPNSPLRQPAIAQMMAAKRDARTSGAVSPEPQPMNRAMTPPANAGAGAGGVATVPAAASQQAGPPRDSLLQHPAKAAEVTVTSGTLAIKAENSSLSQILQEISKSTGMKIDGLGQDERIFGSYGPGDPREVLLSLLDGSGYNVLMVGNDNGAPRQLTLSHRSAGGSSSGGGASTAVARNNREQDDDDIEQEQPQPPPDQPQPGNQPTVNNSDGSQTRSPAEIQQELLRLRQQQQQQQQPPQ